ncbi:hypothetical protein [Dyella agri]|uniref:Uncharacterized protein n=1 Tax=Dyella agri TaxID=1926869 RepID=A0ABW8KBP2_9GAMM
MFDMTDTIECLEAIGSDASLRYASADELTGMLEQAQISTELAKAAASGDGKVLRQMMYGPNQVIMFDPPPTQQVIMFDPPPTQAPAFLDSE